MTSTTRTHCVRGGVCYISTAWQQRVPCLPPAGLLQVLQLGVMTAAELYAAADGSATAVKPAPAPALQRRAYDLLAVLLDRKRRAVAVDHEAAAKSKLSYRQTCIAEYKAGTISTGDFVLFAVTSSHGSAPPHSCPQANAASLTMPCSSSTASAPQLSQSTMPHTRRHTSHDRALASRPPWRRCRIAVVAESWA